MGVKATTWALVVSVSCALIVSPFVGSVVSGLYWPYAASQREVDLVFGRVTGATFLLAASAMFFLFRRVFRDKASTWALVGSVPCALVIASLVGCVAESLYVPYATSDWDLYVVFERVTLATFFLAAPAGFFLLRRLAAGRTRR